MAGFESPSPKRPEPITLPALNSEFDNAFDSDDSDANANFDLRSAIPGLRAKLEEEQASYEAEERKLDTYEEPEQHIEIIQGEVDAELDQNSTLDTSHSRQYMLRRSGQESGDEYDQRDDIPVSPFALEYSHTAQSAPATSTSYSTAITGPEAYQPHRQREGRSLDGDEKKEEEDDAVPVQSLEDVSLDDVPGGYKSTETPPSGNSRPQSSGSRSQSGLDRSTSQPDGASGSRAWPPPEAHAISAPSFQQQFKKTRTKGRSVLQQVISKTRPVHLPPKPREEDQRHLKVWEEMMKKSRQAEEKRKEEMQKRRQAREQAIEESLPKWEAEIVPDCRKVLRDPELRRLWWRGIPTKLRGPLWEKAVGNPLQMRQDMYKACLARAQRALQRGTFPEDSLASLEKDMDETLPALHLFHKETGAMRQDLKDLMLAWIVARSDEGLGYNMGAARIGAMLLINIPLPQAFLTMRNLLDRHCMRSFYGGQRSKEDVEAYFRIFDTLLADSLPKIYFNFKQHHISPSEYLSDWLTTMFIDHLPFESCARIWDVLLLEGDSFLFRAALSIFHVLEPRLFFPDREELMRVLKGESRAALEVAKRAAGAAGTEAQLVDLGARYEVYGLDEETIWERLEESEEWWRESTWSRLIQRELPDV
ncbi:hypothetical protein FRC17_001821 [Serendipita sp. 399]|nr:hypothetical protein FRC17_001821 [Serendipita sp. 399]